MQILAANPAGGTGNDGTSPQPRLVQAAREFEAQMMKELLKPMTAKSILAGADSEPGSGDALGEFGAEALGRALSDHGGFGIANRIVRDLSQSSNRNVTGNEHDDTVIGKIK
jgi:Rod binding domain-containing protein